jgi:hypothetical protein
MTNYDLGTAEITPNTPLIAGSFNTVTYTYTCGHPTDCGGYVKIAFRNMDDFGTPQFENPSAANFCSVRTTGGTLIKPRWDPKGHVRPFNKALYLGINEQYLAKGEKIIVVFGDTSRGSPGWQAPTFPLRRLEFKTLVDPIATFLFKEIPVSPVLSVIHGEPARAVCVAPSDVLINQPFQYFLRVEDRWGNPTDKPQKFEHPGFRQTGSFTVSGKDTVSGITAQSNPIDVFEVLPQLRKFWADFHGQSGETIGSNTIEDYFSFGRDYGFLDILAHQGNDFEVTDAFWEKVNAITKEYYKPGEFVTFPGYEWSGNTPLGGDRNVYFTSEGGRITRSSCELLPGQTSKYEDSMTSDELFKNLRKQTAPKAFTFAHVGGRFADLKSHDPEIELAVEAHSVWGTFEWLLQDALKLGYRVGFVANSDGHKADPGAAYPGNSNFGALGGLTCVLAETLERDNVFAALKARHCYATTGNRSLMDVSLETSDGRRFMMGDFADEDTGKAVLHVRLVGSAPIDRVDVFNGLELMKTMRPFGEDDLGNRIKVTWNGARVRGRDRAVKWDGSLTLEGNTILDAVPINFWNPDRPLQKKGDNRLEWKSFTTGAVRGLILTLGKPSGGTLAIDTEQVKLTCDIDEIGLEAKVWECGELEKALSICRLPDRQKTNEFSFSLPIENLKQGDNPIYIRMSQEDGHLAWSSPIYVVKKQGSSYSTR